MSNSIENRDISTKEGLLTNLLPGMSTNDRYKLNKAIIQNSDNVAWKILSVLFALPQGMSVKTREFFKNSMGSIYYENPEMAEATIDTLIGWLSGNAILGTADLLPKGAGNAINKTIPEIADSQVGKKLVDHAKDYGLTISREGANAYKEITQNVLQNATEIRVGNWKTLGESEFWIYGNDVVIVNNGKWVSTFPLNKPGTVEYINSLPIKK